MTLLQIAVFAALSLPFARLVPAVWRPWLLLMAMLPAVAWLMANDGLTSLEYSLLMATMLLIVAIWWVIQPGRRLTYDDTLALLILTFVLGILWLIQSVKGQSPSFGVMITGSGMVTVAAVSVSGFARSDQVSTHRRLALWLVIDVVIFLFILKSPPLAGYFGAVLTRSVYTSPLVWLGFSYVAFRLMALLLDFRADRLPKDGFALRDIAVYVLFFPAFTAGPIDRAQRFVPELIQSKSLDAPRLVDGGTRIAIGIVKKFVIADGLALVSMNATLIDRSNSVLGLWLVLYLYAFQIFFDFSGYSDVAIGLGRLYGITLPENFDRPYLQPNIQQFWQRWHITLSTWFRVYWFTPLTRIFLLLKHKPPQWVMILTAQLSTMLLIGLWHGATLNFALWGLWHGAGLFAYRMIADNTKGWYRRVSQRTWSLRLVTTINIIVTFHFVALGWVFFALPEVSDSLMMLKRLFGGG